MHQMQRLCFPPSIHAFNTHPQKIFCNPSFFLILKNWSALYSPSANISHTSRPAIACPPPVRLHLTPPKVHSPSVYQRSRSRWLPTRRSYKTPSTLWALPRPPLRSGMPLFSLSFHCSLHAYIHAFCKSCFFEGQWIRYMLKLGGVLWWHQIGGEYLLVPKH